MIEIDTFLKSSNLYPVISLESKFSARKRRLVMSITKYLVYSLPILILLSTLFIDATDTVSINTANAIITKILGVLAIALSIYILMHMGEAYFASKYYFEYVGKNNYQPNDRYTFSVGRILKKAKKGNVLVGFLLSEKIGQKILRRVGVTTKEINVLLEQKLAKTETPSFHPPATLFKVADLLNHILENYPALLTILKKHGVSKEDLLATTNWVLYQIETVEYDRQWWLPEKLAQISTIANDWSFGRTYLLNRYSRNLMSDSEVMSHIISFSKREREVGQVLSTLAREHGANILLVGQPGQEKMEVIWNLAKQIKSREINKKLKNKKLIIFLANDFTASVIDAHDFEHKLHTIFTEALSSGNIIFVIDNLPRLIIQAKQFNLKLPEILDSYFATAHGQIIALADTEYFHTLLANDQGWMNHFETVMTRPLLAEEIIKIISYKTLHDENEYHIFYTYPAIMEIVKSAEYYFTGNISSDKAEDLLAEISPWAKENGLDIITKEDIKTYVSQKTNIPINSIDVNEKSLLLNLEKILMQRVVAQREAVFAVANSIRRSRAGIRNENRPIGSFLFLGPTGVGKTETAKALAATYFKDEKLLMRLDMSEYQNTESLSRLIGSAQNQTQGVLATMLRERPYGVLLLDEFEKTNKDILNLFLQIIDEGYFTDAFGKKVLARNIMFIATSNAGAEKIFDLINKGENLHKHEPDIINDIVQKNIFKPELINRFDATVLFHPLTRENLTEIATLMLKKVGKKMTEKGMTLNIDSTLVDFIVRGGYNPTFGARPMNRMIQDTVEQHIADLIIRDQIVPGQTISFEVLDSGSTKNSLQPRVE